MRVCASASVAGASPSGAIPDQPTTRESALEPLVHSLIFLLGLGALLPTLLPFSPMTADLVLLPRKRAVTLFRWRRVLWAVGGTLLGLLLILGGLGTAHPFWLWAVAGTGGLLALLFWSGYVPLIMTPPSRQRLLSAERADELLDPDTQVLGLEYNGEARAYPRDLLARPHYLNDEVGGRPVLISYCILCNSGMAFEAEMDGRRLDLRCLTAINNNIIYFEPTRGNFIQQLDGAVFEGPDAGRQLTHLPLLLTTWRQWRALHPETQVGYAPPVTLRDRLVNAMLRWLIPLEKLARRSSPWHRLERSPDPRLPAMTQVLGVEFGGDRCAVPVERARALGVLQAQVGAEPVAILYDTSHDTGSVFSRRQNGRCLTFEPVTGEGSAIVARDRETGSLWDVHGRARTGPLAGERLTEIPHYNKLFWFAWSHFKASTRLCGQAA